MCTIHDSASFAVLPELSTTTHMTQLVQPMACQARPHTLLFRILNLKQVGLNEGQLSALLLLASR